MRVEIVARSRRVFWDLDSFRIADFRDRAVANDDGLMRQDSFLIHRDHVDVDERDNRRGLD